ncbi:hypothetical protein JOF28_002308 [Leucobacter exalbidus]|uniref:Large extracellular alpha-helical protein n=1 Tax=Leucobacter exalbidus TaxID=662960 RepID=A0A940T6J8_9MICO|nr:DUF5719 family protein [Leucobacter exalbidus]MBP1327076.1 hypothetical protein [Leucobacter exalbidus]
MNTKSSPLTIGMRATVGALVIAAATAAVVLVGSVEVPSAVREPLSLVADTTQNTARTLVCSGSFGELGADPEQAEVAVPTGPPVLASAGAKTENSSLERATGGEGLPEVLRAGNTESIAAAQLQHVTTENLSGAVASACAEPLNEQWLIGGGTDAGVSTTLDLGNPGSVPASVQITVFDDEGEVDAVQTAGVIVLPGTQQTISLNGYAPDRAHIAVRVTSSGAPVTASMGVAQRVGLSSFGVSSVDRQAEPNTQLVIAGINNAADHGHEATDAGEGDPYPVMVRAFAPGGEATTVRLRALDAKGHATDLGEMNLAENAVGNFNVTTWPEGSAALVVTADVPVIAAALGSAETVKKHDYEWFVPSPVIAAGEVVDVPVVPNGTLVLVHPGEGKAEVTITPVKGKPRKLTLSPGATQSLEVANGSTITATADIFAGVRYEEGASIASYPVLPPSQRDGTLTVFTR